MLENTFTVVVFVIVVNVIVIVVNMLDLNLKGSPLNLFWFGGKKNGGGETKNNLRWRIISNASLMSTNDKPVSMGPITEWSETRHTEMTYM